MEAVEPAHRPNDSMGLGISVSLALTVPSGMLGLYLGFQLGSLAGLFGLPLLAYSALGIPLALKGYDRTAKGLVIGSAAFYILYVAFVFFLAWVMAAFSE